ncbi:MAG: hypothetical protein WCP55_22295 [Lentisphaerota bacterium]
MCVIPAMKVAPLVLLFVLQNIVLGGDADAKARVELANDLCKVVVTPEDGGACVSWEMKDKAFTLPLQADAELFREVFSNKEMEGKPKSLTFSPRLLPGDGGTTLSLEAKLDTSNSDEAVAGLSFKRDMILPTGKRCLVVKQTLSNPTQDPMEARVGVRQQVLLGSDRAEETFLPSERGVLRICGKTIDGFYSKNDWECNPVENWLAVLNPKSKSGLVFVLEAESVEGFYTQNDMGVCGWLANAGILMPGESATVTYTVIPVNGFSGMVHASPRILADVQIKAAGNIELSHRIAGATSPLGDVIIKSSICNVKSKTVAGGSEITLKGVGVNPVEALSTVNQAQSEPVIVRVEVSGKGWKESYETYFEGSFRIETVPFLSYKPDYKRTKAGFARNPNSKSETIGMNKK